jgi:hypothetical protein
MLIVGLAAGVAGCVDVTTATGPDGRPNFTIDCDGESSGCFSKAGDLCPGGYFLIDRRNGSTEMPHTAGVVATPHTRIVIECK